MKLRTVLGTFVLIVALSGANAAFAQPPEEVRYDKYDFNKLMKSFDASLRSDIPGVVESTIYNLVEYKSYFPGREYTKIVRELDGIARAYSDSSIAYKAGLTSLYLTYGAPISNPEAFTPYNHEIAFKLASEQLEKKFLLSRSGE